MSFSNPYLQCESPHADVLSHILAFVDALPSASRACLSDPNVILKLAKTQLSLNIKGLGFKPFTLDFSAPEHQRKVTRSALKHSLLARACQAHLKPRIWDLTCGWGGDSFVLASTGSCVLSVERHPLVALMVQVAQSALQGGDHWHVVCSSAAAVLNDASLDSPDVLYLDPMFPAKPRGRCSGKAMQILAYLSEQFEAAPHPLLSAALSYPQVRRVVLKYPRKSKPPVTPDQVIQGRSIQFCIYHRHSTSRV